MKILYLIEENNGGKMLRGDVSEGEAMRIAEFIWEIIHECTKP